MTRLSKSLGIYIHWPYCAKKCPYCDFNSHVRAGFNEDAWLDGILQELSHYAEITGVGRQVASVFFGGGTPSLMNPVSTKSILDHVHKLWSASNELEITLEANPGSSEAEKFQGYREAGINRLSLGVQALDDESLKSLGRIHSAEEGIKAIEMAARLFPRFSFDLIYTRPEQTLEDWRDELTRALTFGAGHMSLYQLTIEPQTAFATLYERGELVIPEDDEAADFYALTEEMMTAAGFASYEVSNYAKPAQECRHNLVYWHYDDYIGVGPGAHGRLTVDGKRYLTEQIKAPEPWLEAVKQQGHGTKRNDAIPFDLQVKEHLLMGLRLTEGVSRETVLKRYGTDMISEDKIAILQAEGLLHEDPQSLRVTPKGRLCLNGVYHYLCES